MKLCFQWFECNLENSLTEYRDEIGLFKVPGSSCFYRDWNEMMCRGKCAVLRDLFAAALFAAAPALSAVSAR